MSGEDGGAEDSVEEASHDEGEADQQLKDMRSATQDTMSLTQRLLNEYELQIVGRG